jgi:hypothetical protein
VLADGEAAVLAGAPGALPHALNTATTNKLNANLIRVRVPFMVSSPSTIFRRFRSGISFMKLFAQ